MPSRQLGNMLSGSMRAMLEHNERVAIRTPDQREYRGRFLERRRDDQNSREYGVVRLDSGWLTSYPIEMIHPLESQRADES